MAPKPVLGYWNFRGIAEFIRTMLAYLKVDYEDKQYQLKADMDRSEWLKEKFTLGLDFPNLPYYIDGDVKLTQSCAIIRYLARKYKLDGTTDEEKNRIALVEYQLRDQFSAYSRVAYNPDCDNLKGDYLKTVPDAIKLFANFLDDRPYVAGANISYVDFLLHDYLVRIKVFVPGTLDPHANLAKYVERINSLPGVSEFIKTRKSILFNGPMAKWNATL